MAWATRIVFEVCIAVWLAHSALAQTAAVDSANRAPGWWDDIDPVELARMVVPYQNVRDEENAQAKLLFEYLGEKYLGELEKAASVPLEDWRFIIAHLCQWPQIREALEAAWKPQFLTLLSSRFGVSAEDSATLTGFMFPGPSHARVAQWMETTDRWKGYDPRVLSLLVGRLTKAGEQGRSSMFKLVGVIRDRFLGSPDLVRKIDLTTWERLSNSVGELAPRLGSIWAARIRTAFVEDQDVFQSLSPAELLSLVSTLSNLGGEHAGDGLAVRWVRNKPLESLKPEDWLSLARAGIFGDGRDDPIFRTLLLHLADRYLRDEASTRSLPLRVWTVASKIAGYLNPSQRAAWANRIRAAFLNSPDFGAMPRVDVTALSDAISRLTSAGDASVFDEVHAAWLAAADIPAWQRSYAVAVVDRVLVQGPPETETTRLHEQVQRRRNELLRSMSAGMTPTSMGSLPRESAAQLVGAIEAVGDRQAASLVRAQWKLCQDTPGAMCDPAEAKALSGTALRLLLRLTAWAQPVDRQRVWQEGLAPLSHLFLSAGMRLSIDEETIQDFDRLAEAVQDHGLAGRVLDDLLGICDGAGKPELMKRWVWLRLTTIQEPASAHQTALSAVQADRDGNWQEAAASYAQAAGQAGPGDLANLARLRQVWVLVDGDASENVEPYLQSLLQAEPGFLRECAWNLSCRSLFRKLASGALYTKAAYDERVNAIASAGDNASLYPATAAELDACLAKMHPESVPTALELLTDLFLMTPETAAMWDIQARRIRLLSEAGQLKEALAAGRLQVALSLGSPEGPRHAVLQCADIMARGGAAPSEVQAFQSHVLFDSPLVEASGGAASRRAEGPIAEALGGDSLLRSRAGEILQGDTRQLSTHRQAWLHLLGGQTREALQEAHRNWVSASKDGSIGDRWGALGDLGVLLAASDGTIRGYDRFARIWASPGGQPVAQALTSSQTPDDNLARLARCHQELIGTGSLPSTQPGTQGAIVPGGVGLGAALPVWDQKLLLWSIQALKEGDSLWAETFGLWATTAPGSDEQSRAGWERRFARYSDLIPNYGSDENLRELLAVAPQAPPQARHRLWARVVQLRFTSGDFSGCVKALERSGVLAGQETDGAMECGLVGAAAYLKLGQHDAALKLLESTRSWEGSEEQHARALALEGWAYLDLEQTDKASSAFEEILKTYPNTKIAVRAREIANRLGAPQEVRL